MEHKAGRRQAVQARPADGGQYDESHAAAEIREGDGSTDLKIHGISTMHLRNCYALHKTERPRIDCFPIRI